ncbi:MAG: hypothetical protein ACXWUR_07500, partial [Allosphingosinicella sp.]
MTVCVEKSARPAPPFAARLMAGGGDARIVLDPETGLNRYHSAPMPSGVMAYASSTANDVSPAAFAHVARRLDQLGGQLSGDDYAAELRGLRARIRRAYGLADETAIVFAASGTDLEYVALACVGRRAGGGTYNILLGADEVGSGCIHSAHGRYFAERTALGVATEPGEPVPGLEIGSPASAAGSSGPGGVLVDLVDVPVRNPHGEVRSSAEITAAIDESIAVAQAASRHPLVHVVHGSKTGLILPLTEDLDRLREAHGDDVTFVVDACQARITSAAVNDYLARGAIVFLTGSKFMGGPPFSGFALLPQAVAERAPPLAEGLAGIFRRGEWPGAWPGAAILPNTSNPGLLLRLEASIFELERFQDLPTAAVERVILAFHAAVRAEIVALTPARRVAPYPPGDREEADTHPIEMRTLSTLDLSAFP